MKNIAFVSYEYPPDTGFGGIATYIYQIAHAFAARGISVFVICATPNKSVEIFEGNNLSIFKLQCADHKEFLSLAPLKLAAIHQQYPLQLIEVPDFCADGLYIKKYLPSIPLIVKLHTPTYLVNKLNNYHYYNRWFKKILPPKKNIYQDDPEYIATMQADYILSPSLSLIQIITKEWKIEPGKITYAPNPYIPKDDLLKIETSIHSKSVLYTGRLETRKGVFTLAKAIPLVLAKVADANFVFVGSNTHGPYRKGDMKTYLLATLKESASRVTFIDHVSLNEMSKYYKDAAICIYPSIWENFPNVCLEAMSAGKIIIASKEGGMREMLEDINGGILIDPLNEKEIADACVNALNNPEQFAAMGERCRKKISRYYADVVINQLLELYEDMRQQKPIDDLHFRGYVQ